MDTEKYYVPSIEEFCHGFEYEFCNDVFDKENLWKKESFDISYPDFKIKSLGMIYNIKEIVQTSLIRVKYLDEDDILSLGFEKTPLQYEIHANGVTYFLMKFPHHENKYEIRCVEPSNNYGGFYGIIKNKSELEKLMQQTGILMHRY